MHSAKATLPRAALGKEPPVKNPSAKNSLPIAFLSGTRQSLRRVQSRHSAKKSDRHGAGCVSTCFAECHVRGARQRFLIFVSKFLCRVPYRVGTRQRFFIFFNNFFAECPARSALGKYFLIFFVISLPSALALTLGKEAFFYSIFTNTAYKRYV